jgi:class 3 adenylate cyclase
VVVDLDALEAAGIANVRERSALIEYLDGLGFTADEMVEAERRGRLFGLAGDALQRSGRPTYSLRTAADALGVPLPEVERAWAALGLIVASADELALSEADVAGLTTWVDIKALVGDDRALGLLRVTGAALERLAEAQLATVRAASSATQLDETRDELATATAYRAVAEFIPRTAAMIDAVLRHHLAGARAHFEGVIRDSSASVVCGIGFADLSGFTALTQVLSPTELSDLLNEFSGVVSDVVHNDGGRVVKFIGDEVMWVTSTPDRLVKVAIDLVEHPSASAAGLRVRAGLAYGSVLAIAGDYFGNPVNLAARLVAAAAPGQILASTDVHDALPNWPTVAGDPLTLKGFEALVTAYDMNPGGQ